MEKNTVCNFQLSLQYDQNQLAEHFMERLKKNNLLLRNKETTVEEWVNANPDEQKMHFMNEVSFNARDRLLFLALYEMSSIPPIQRKKRMTEVEKLQRDIEEMPF